MLIAAALVAGGLALAPEAGAATTVLTVNASADTYTNASSTTRNYGSSSSLTTRTSPGAVAFLRFALPAFPAGTTLTGATLRLRTTSNSGAGSSATQSFRITTDTWTEGGLTWATMPPLTGTVLGTSPPMPTRSTTYTTTFATAPLATLSGRTLSIAMQSSGTDTLIVGSRQASTTSARPLLTLTFTSAADTTAPTAPGSPTATVSGSTVTLGWGSSTDDVGVTAYDVHRSTSQGFTPSASTLVGSTASLAYNDTNRPAGTWYYRIVARDAAGNSSTPSALVVAVVSPPPDTTPPSQVSGVTAAVTGSSVALAWAAAGDDVGVTAYDVHRSTSATFTPSASTLRTSTSQLSWSDTGVATGTWYYRVVARDLAGNAGAPSTAVRADVVPPTDSTPPTTPGSFTGSVSGSTVTLSWTASTDDTSVTGYDVHTSTDPAFAPSAATLIGTTTALGWTAQDVAVGTRYYRVVARDAAGNSSTPTAPWTATVQPPPDTTSPTTPTSVSATADGSSISVTWAASTDDTGVVGYEVHRSTTSGFTPSPGTRLGTTATTGWTDTGLAPGTYFYVVIAYDAVPNRSAPSAEVQATVLAAPGDTTAPTAPTGLVSSAPGTTPRISWLASSDDSGVVAYELHRSTTAAFTPSSSTLVGTTAATGLEDPAVPSGTWQYRVVAIDGAGNRSTASDPLPVAIVSGPATTLSVDAIADTYGNKGAPTTNFGTSSSLASRGGLYVSWLRYVLPTNPGTAPLAAVNLRFRTNGDPVGAPSTDTQTVYFASDSWSETTLTWTNQPSPTGPVAGTLPPAPGVNVAYTANLDATAFLPRLGQQVTLAITSPAGTDPLWFWSRNHANTTYHPWLDLVFASPVVADVTPPSAPSGLVGLAAPSTVHLAWAAGTDLNGIRSYDVEISTDPAFPASSTTRVTGIPRTTFDDHNKAPGTYWYRVTAIDPSGNRSAASAPLSVEVTEVATDVTLLAVGDLVCVPGSVVSSSTCRHADVAAMVAAQDPDWFLPLGDIQYENGIYADFMAPTGYNGSFSEFLPRSLPIVGNHEYADPSGPGVGYFRYFDPTGSGAFGSNPGGYYTRALSPSWRLIVVNSECSSGIENANQMLAGGCGVGSPEYTWLEGVLQSSTEKCLVAAFHRPRWSTQTASTNPSSYPEMAPLWDLMTRYGVDLGLSGHKHASEVFAPIGESGAGDPVGSTPGMRQFVAGAGGKNLGAFDALSGAIGTLVQARDNTTFGGLRLTLKDGSYDWAFVPVAGQSFTNAGTTGSFSGTENCR